MTLLTFKRKYVDGKLIALLAGFYTLFYVIFIIKTVYMRTYVYTEVKYSLFHIIVYGYLIDWLIVVGYMSLIAISTKRLIIKNVPWKNIFLLHLSLSLLIGVIIRILIIFHSVIIGEMTFSDVNIRDNINSFFAVLDLNFLIYFAMIFIIYVYYYVNQVRLIEAKRRVLETQLVNTRMKMLSSQLQPHFLFNTLNSISSLIEIDAKSAQNTIADLSDFLREILYNSGSKFITLEKELSVLEYYLNLVRIRFSDHLTIKMNIEDGLQNVKIPSMILQPLVENSVKHGYSYDHTDLTIIITISKKNNDLLIEVENNGKLFSVDLRTMESKGVGIY